MLDPDGLNVWSDQQLVGYLWRNTQGLIGFRYEEEWLAQGEFAISHTLPLQQEDFTPEDSLAHRFFANLLPEGGVRDQIVRDLKIANTDFDLHCKYSFLIFYIQWVISLLDGNTMKSTMLSKPLIIHE